jgi:SAM-dependent methyltransferase
MIERSEHLSATSEAYDAIADLYAEIAADYLDPLPLDRAVLAAYAEYVRGARDRFGSNAGTGSTSASGPRIDSAAGPNPAAGLATEPGTGAGSTAEQATSADSVADPGSKDPLVAELGCGPGYVTAHLAKLGLDVFGVDLSPAMIDLAREAYPELRFELGSMDALDIADGALQGVVSWYSIIHAPQQDVPAYIAEFSRVLTPGGHLLLGFFESAGDPVTQFDHKVAPAYRWPIDELAKFAGDAGFTEVGRMLREPGEGERFRRGHLIMRREN